MFDLIVIGGGPAGTSAAITSARAGSRVLLLEQGRFPRQKVCGEFVSAEALTLLAWLLDAEHGCVVANVPRIQQARIFSDGLTLTIPVHPAAASITRFELDAALWRAAKASGVDARDETKVTGVEGNGPFTVRSDGGTYEARGVVNASGRWSRLTAAVDVQNGARFLGLKAHFAEQDALGSTDLYFFDRGYCGVQPIAPGRINVCAMVRAGVASKLSGVFEQNPALHARSKHWQVITDPTATSPLIFRKLCPTAGGILRAGDAAGFVDPFAGDGISLALRSGHLAARCLLQPDPAAAYKAAYFRELAPIFRANSKVRAVFTLPRILRKAALATIAHTPGLARLLLRTTR